MLFHLSILNVNRFYTDLIRSTYKIGTTIRPEDLDWSSNSCDTGKVEVQKMADLPEDRLTPGPPFSAVGVDTFGPWNVITRRTPCDSDHPFPHSTHVGRVWEIELPN
jgi:hypothetical protein